MINWLLAQAHQHDAATESFFEHIWHVSDWLPHYLELINDPAHVALELTLMLIFDGIIFGLIWKALRSYVRSHHAEDIEDIVSAEHDLHEIDDIENRIARIEHKVEVLLQHQERKLS